MQSIKFSLKTHTRKHWKSLSPKKISDIDPYNIGTVHTVELAFSTGVRFPCCSAPALRCILVSSIFVLHLCGVFYHKRSRVLQWIWHASKNGQSKSSVNIYPEGRWHWGCEEHWLRLIYKPKVQLCCCIVQGFAWQTTAVVLKLVLSANPLVHPPSGFYTEGNTLVVHPPQSLLSFATSVALNRWRTTYSWDSFVTFLFPIVL